MQKFLIFNPTIVQNIYQNLSSMLLHARQNTIMSGLIKILGAANILFIAAIINSMQISTGQFRSRNAIARIGRHFQLSELKAFHA